MVPSGMRSAHQCVRTDSSPVSSADICLSTDICLPDGRSPFPRPDESGLYTLGLVTACSGESLSASLLPGLNNVIADQE